MCYERLCPFQNWQGDCTINGHREFQKRFSYSPCIIAGTPWDPEDEKHIKDLEHNLAFLYARQQLLKMNQWDLFQEIRKV